MMQSFTDENSHRVGETKAKTVRKMRAGARDKAQSKERPTKYRLGSK